MKTCLRLMCVVMIALAAAMAQPQSSSPASRGLPVRGEISSGSVVTSTLTVELSFHQFILFRNCERKRDGTFEFRSALSRHLLASRIRRRRRAHPRGDGQRRRSRPDSLHSPQQSIQRQPLRRQHCLAAATNPQGSAPGPEGLRQRPPGGSQRRPARSRGTSSVRQSKRIRSSSMPTTSWALPKLPWASYPRPPSSSRRPSTWCRSIASHFPT